MPGEAVNLNTVFSCRDSIVSSSNKPRPYSYLLPTCKQKLASRGTLLI